MVWREGKEMTAASRGSNCGISVIIEAGGQFSRDHSKQMVSFDDQGIVIAIQSIALHLLLTIDQIVVEYGLLFGSPSRSRLLLFFGHFCLFLLITVQRPFTLLL